MMMASVDDILETTQLIVDDEKNCVNDVNEKFKKVAEISHQYIEHFSLFRDLCTRLTKVIDREGSMLLHNDDLEENEKYLKNMEIAISELKKMEIKESKEVLEKEKYLKDLEKCFAKTKDDLSNINIQKCIVLTYKLLTKTSFIYNSRSVSGLMNTSVLKTFIFKLSDMSQEEITQKLWLMLQDKE